MRLIKRAAALLDLDKPAEMLQKQGAALALRFLGAAETTMKGLATLAVVTPGFLALMVELPGASPN